MPFIEWEKKFELGVKEIDQQHKYLFDLITKTDKAYHEGKADHLVSSLLDEFLDYASVHFETEESVFNATDYRHKEQHIAKHRDFQAKVLEMKQNCSGDKPLPIVEILNFGKFWLVNHILNDDMALRRWIKKD